MSADRSRIATEMVCISFQRIQSGSFTLAKKAIQRGDMQTAIAHQKDAAWAAREARTRLDRLIGA